MKRFANRPAAVSEIGDRPGVVLAGFLSMNLKTLALILKGLRVSGSWSQCTAKMAWGLSMNRGFQVHSPVESGGAPPHSKTLARWPQGPNIRQIFLECARCCAALDLPRGASAQCIPEGERRLERSADFQSALSPNCIRRSVGSAPRSGVSDRLAECNSAIQQSTTLRYDGGLNNYTPSAGLEVGSRSQRVVESASGLPLNLAGPRRGVVVARSIFLSMFLAALSAAGSSAANGEDRATVIVVVGAPGEEQFGKNFEQWTALWEKACRDAGAKFVALGRCQTNAASDLEQLKHTLALEPKDLSSELWLVLIGHGTFDGKEARFNLRGPDFSASELEEWLKPFHRPLAVINCASSSGPFLNKLSATNRVIVTATRSGYEQNYARFGQFVAEAITDPQADLDKDGQTSLLEMFLAASQRVAEFYDANGRLATEHALLDDNGDRLGTPAAWFRGIRAVKKAADGAALDGLRAHQFHLIRSEQERKLSPETRVRRDELELRIARLRESKGQMTEDDYYQQLEKLLIEVARLYDPSSAKP